MSMNPLWTPAYQLLREALRSVREKSGKTQVQIATLLEKPQSYISKIESGERKLDILEIRNYCRACDMDWLNFLSVFEQKLSEIEQKNGNSD